MPTTPRAMPIDTAQRGPTLKTRPRRFPIQTPLCYRQRGAAEWNETITVNISRSGVLFETARELPVDTLLEMKILFPATITRGEPANVICWGPVVRTESSKAAAAIIHYRFRRITA
jgi:hypothetical protein